MITVAFTRPSRRLEESIKLVESMGMQAIAAPSLDIIHGHPDDYSAAKDMLLSGGFSVSVFASPTAAEECAAEWGEGFGSYFRETKNVAIGPKTAKALEGYGIPVHSIPEEYTSAGLVADLTGSEGKVLIVHSDHGSPVLTDGLREKGIAFSELTAYRLEKHEGGLDPIREAVLEDRVDAIAFTSRMSAESFVESVGIPKDKLFSKAKAAAIGRPTADKLTEMEIGVDIIPANATFSELMEAIKEYFSKE